MDQKEYQSLILGALLHDVGKFYQRTGLKLNAEDEYWITVCCKKFHTPYGERYSHQHAVYSGKFIRHYLKGHGEVEVLAMHHHLPNNAPKKHLAKLITLADWLASGERRDREVDEELGDPTKEPLVSIFSKISLDGRKVPEHYVPIKPLNASLDGMFPASTKDQAISKNSVAPGSYNFLWEQFTKEIKDIDRADLINQILFLLEKYTLCIPAATYKDKPDLSLFHHSKSVGAIAVCLYHMKLNEKKIDQILKSIKDKTIETDLMKEALFLLVGGDISGIQDFIYSVTSSKALKGLRGRSLYLQLLSEAIAKLVLDKFNLPMANLLYCGGGHFYVLLPFVDDVEKRLNSIRRRVDKILLKAHHGNLSAIIAWQPVSCKDFLDFASVWQKLSRTLARKKRHKLSDFFINSEDAIKVLGPYEIGGEMAACEVCGEEIERGEQCLLCESFTDLSRKLATAKSIKVMPTVSKLFDKGPNSWSEILKALGYFYSFSEKEDRGAMVINSTDFVGRYAGYKFIAHNTPVKGDREVMTLEDIAEEAKGIKKWGVFRADVDNLGKIFSEGLGEDRTISRVSMLSYMLSIFFSARVDRIIDDFKNKAYVVYSGGDDLFILGAWSVLPEIAARIYEDFRKFTCQNLTISGGLYLAPSAKFPVYQAAHDAGEAVDKAKDNPDKNHFTIFDKTVPWSDLEKISDIKERIRSLLEDYGRKSVPRSLLSTLYAGWQEKQLLERREISMLRIWRLFYAFKKLMEGYKDRDTQLAELNELLKRSITDFDLMPYLDIAVRWADYLTRKEV